MTKKETGGPAFPTGTGWNHEGNWVGGDDAGMTLRDYFAGQELVKTEGTYICDVPEAYDHLADHCYRMADAMLKARKQ